MQAQLTCRDCARLPLDVDFIYTIIDTHMLKTPHIILVNLVALYNGINPYIGTLKKERGVIFSECCTKILNKNSSIM